MTIEVKFRYKTSDGRVLLPIIHVDYKCKKCGFTNELVMLTGDGHQFVDASKSVPHDSLCHKCDDVEIITIEREIEAEREACAQIAETPISGEQDDITMEAKDRVAKAIRARSTKGSDV